MPIAPFRDLFMGWPDNHKLSIKDLRLKAITLLALTLMLRPSDIAPKSVYFDAVSNTSKPVIFSTDNLCFAEGNLTVTFHGIKNDTSRSGFEVTIPSSVEEKLDPVQTLHSYIEKTQKYRPEVVKPVFLSLNPPFKAITAPTVSKIMEEAIKLAGLGGVGYTAKDFRPTGATVAIDTDCDPDIVMKLGC